MAYQPHLFIGIGSKHCLFTLRETYEERFYKKCPITGRADLIGTEIRSFHHCNLGQDVNEVIAKAQDYSRSFGIPLSAASQDPEQVKAELNKIRRSTAEEMAAKIEAAAWAESNRYDEFNDRWMFENLLAAPLGKFSFGKHEGKTYAEINEIDRGYLEFMATPRNDRDERPIDELRRLHLETWLERNESNQIEETDELVGYEGDKVELCVFVKEARDIATDYGMTKLVKAVTEAGNRITIWYAGHTINFEKKVGGWMDIKATVKKHDEFRGEWSTTLTRVREVV
jgi:hypothetical protein